MLAFWDPASFTHIVDYESWELELLEDETIAEHLGAGKLVPLNILCDGRFGVLVRGDATAEPDLTERERKYLSATSQPYLFRSSGIARISGIEEVGAFPDPSSGPDDMAPTEIEVPAGEYAVTVHLIDWEAEPGILNDQGEAAESALPDFVVLIGPAAVGPFRTDVETFDDND